MSDELYNDDDIYDGGWFEIGMKWFIFIIAIIAASMVFMKLDQTSDDTKAELAKFIKYTNRFNYTIVGYLQSNDTFKSVATYKIKSSVYGGKDALFLSTDTAMKNQPYTLFVFGVESDQQSDQQVEHNRTYAFRVIESTCSIELLWSVPAVKELDDLRMMDLNEAIGGFCK